MHSRTFRSAVVILCAVPIWLAGEHVGHTQSEPDADSVQDLEFRDIEVQGEYVGDQTGMQVVAVGDGEFDVILFEGGLPGAGARAVPPRRIEGDADTVAGLTESMGLRKVVRKSPTLGATAPAGGMVLFDGTPESLARHWSRGKIVDDGLLAEGATTKESFGDYTLHVEFRTPFMPTASGQARGNSGIYHQSRYETQILDSFGLEGRDNEAGGIYTVSPPAINACFPPMTWQTYDVDFTAARYDDSGKKVADARMTVRLNGITVQADVAVPGATRASRLKEGPEPAPIDFQDHGDPVRFRNIWLVPRDAEKEARRPIVPGFERFFAATSQASAAGGSLLTHSLACDACHASDTVSSIPAQRGPDLRDIVGRVRFDSIAAMIADPHQLKPGTTMPDPWPGLGQAERDQRAAAITNYLVSISGGKLIERAGTEQTAKSGQRLYHTVGCTACHPRFDGGQTPPSTTVPLGDLSSKYSSVSLMRFLQNPHAVRPGHRMPGLVGSAEEAFAIATFLTRDVTVRPGTFAFTRTLYKGRWNKLPDFDSLDPIRSEVVADLSLDSVKPKNNFALVYQASLPIAADGKYTFHLTSDDGSALEIDGKRLDNDSIHPAQTKSATYELKAGTYPIRIEYFDGGGQTRLSLTVVDPVYGQSDIAALISGGADEAVDFLPSDLTIDESQIEQGRVWFASAGCVACHEVDDPSMKASPSIAMNQLRPDRGCLAETVVAPAMNYELNRSQKAAIVASLEQGSTFDDATNIHVTMAAMNCYACHVRGKLGGPEAIRDEIFQTTIPEMGLEGRLPPALDGVGDKLTDASFASAMEKGSNLRDYMLTRMPAFGYEGFEAFHRSINQTDRRGEMKSADHSGDHPVDHSGGHDGMVAAGRQLVGNRGLSCVKCHRYDGESGGGLGAIDLLTMPQRLRVEWFHRYLQDPTEYRPGTRMPNSFVDGKSALAGLYDGDPTLQIDAMWQYLSLGDQAKEPEGLRPGAIVLVADERPRIYRNFFTGLSARGIGVGYPSGVNVIWDAEAMSLAKAWRNSFIDASMHWVGRGQGRQEPLGDAVISVDPATPIAVLDAIDSAWPKQSGRDQGYRFGGYHLDPSGNPTFRYRLGQTRVTDGIVPASETGGPLVRRIVIEAAGTNGVLVWQVASGDIRATGDGYRVDDRFDVTIDGADCQLVRSNGGQSLRVIVPAGETMTLTQSVSW